MADAEVPQLDAMLPVVKDHDVAVEQRRQLQLRGLEVGAVLRFAFPPARFTAEEAGLVFLHLAHDVLVRHRDGAVVRPHLVAIRMVAVVVSVEREADGLVGLRAYLRDDELCARRIVGVEDEHVVLEDDPAGVAVPLPVQIALVKVNVGRELLDRFELPRDLSLIEESDEDDRRHHVHCHTLHGRSFFHALGPHPQRWLKAPRSNR